MGEREEALWQAQLRAEAMFEAIVAKGLLRAGVLESELNDELQVLAKKEFGVRRHWHKRIVRSGVNTLTTFRDNPPDRRLEADDVIYLDFGPVFGEWEADFGRTYALGSDPRKHQLVQDISAAFARGKALFESKQDLTAGEIYDYVVELAREAGWEFGASTAGHIVDLFPHGRDPEWRESICHGNNMSLREPFSDGRTRHWILEIHFVDRVRGYGGFLEELLTIRGPSLAAG